jgi:hypothetical protein
VQPQPPLALRLCGFHLFAFRQRRKQRLRFRDLGHFRGRREAFDCRGEDGMGLGETGVRLVELGERERR